MSAVEQIEQSTATVDGETVVVSVTKPGDFVVCNLASLSLGNIDVNRKEEITQLVKSAVRALDNVIDLNYFPGSLCKDQQRTLPPHWSWGKRLPPHACKQ